MKKKLKYYGGEGFSYAKEVGKFKVSTDKTVSHFNSLSEAKTYYESLNVGKAIWDLTNGADLLDAYT